MPVQVSFINIWEGQNKIIKAAQLGTRCPAKDFIDKLEEKEQKKLYVLFDKFDMQNGRVCNTQKLRKLHTSCEGCFELKPTAQDRISFIYLKYPPNCICLLDGFKKKQKKWPQNKIKKTIRLCKEVQQYKQGVTQ